MLELTEDGAAPHPHIRVGGPHTHAGHRSRMLTHHQPDGVGGLIDQIPPLPRAQKVLVERQGLHASGMRRGELGADDGQRRIALLAASSSIPQAPQRHLPGGGLSPHIAVGGGDPLREAPRVRDPDAVHRHLGLQVRPLLLGAGRVARLLQGPTHIGDELCDPRIRLSVLRHPRSSSPRNALPQTYH